VSAGVKRARLLIGAAVALTSVWAIAQDAPESLLPPEFDRPASPPREPTPPPPAASPAPGAPRTTAQPVIQPLPKGENSTGLPAGPGGRTLPSLSALEAMSPEELDVLLGIRPRSDMPPAARRALLQTGVMDASEGGMPARSLAAQDASLVRVALTANQGRLVSRWGHILLRRALASRLDAPAGMEPADFVALRASLLLRMGEGQAARALVQDVDAANYTPALTQAALDSYLATADITGLCPVMSVHGSSRKDPQWQVLRSVCAAFSGDARASMAQLDRQLYVGTLPRIDMMLAQKYAGTAGKGAQRAVTIDWEGVTEMTPFRYAMALGTGVTPPAALMTGVGPQYPAITATAPMVGLADRAAAADRAGSTGVLSSAAMVDLYSQIFETDDITGEWGSRAAQLRDAYVAETPEARLAAMRLLWTDAGDPVQRYSRQVLTAYSAARLPALAGFSADAGPLIASMLAAGLDANALRWAGVAEVGSEGWALLALADPRGAIEVGTGAFDSFSDDDESVGRRKSAFLLAGLAGLGRIEGNAVGDLSGKLSVDLAGQTRWTRLIGRAAEVDNQGLVALLAALGMQGTSWDKMTPRYLYHIVSALHRVGLSAEARMIAAEAVARA
jgi:hypothetical protein